MDITYDTIINYLTKKKNLFSSKANIMRHYNDFFNFKDCFDESFFRYGIHIYDDNNNNISLLSSIIFCLDNKYFFKDKSEILDLVDAFKKYVNLTTYNIESIDEITNKLKINILLFDFKENDILSSYYSDFLNPWRPILYLAKYEEFFEPICTQDDKIFSFSSNKVNILKNNILSREISYVTTDKDLSKEFQINDNYNEILDIDNLVSQEVELDENSDQPFTNQTSINKNLTKSKLNKMKKNTIIELIEELEVDKDINNLSKLIKKDLIELVSKKLNL